MLAKKILIHAITRHGKRRKEEMNEKQIVKKMMNINIMIMYQAGVHVIIKGICTMLP